MSQRSTTANTPNRGVDARRVQRRVIGVLAAGQVLGGLGAGATLSLGALLIAEIANSSALSGMAATMATLGAAVFAVPLARRARTHGRRLSLSTGAFLAVGGALLVVVAAVTRNLPALLAGILLLGAGQAVNLQARYAATDGSHPTTRGRDLSLVVWATTVGAVAGPNLFEPGTAVGTALGLPALSGGFVVSAVAQALGGIVYLIGLPRQTRASRSDRAERPRNSGALALLRARPAAGRAVLTVALSHAVMVALMSMTPIHLSEHGASLSLIGLTISLHVAGMYALSPVFGALTDRLGARNVVLLGQTLFLFALVLTILLPANSTAVTASLVLLGLGWSASVVAGSTLVAGAVDPSDGPALQGISDSLMNLAGAGGGALSGLALIHLGFDGLAATLLVLVVVVTLAQLRRPGEQLSVD